MQIKEIVLCDFVFEEEVVEMLAVGDKGSEADAILLAIGLHGITGAAIIHQFEANLAI